MLTRGASERAAFGCSTARAIDADEYVHVSCLSPRAGRATRTICLALLSKPSCCYALVLFLLLCESQAVSLHGLDYKTFSRCRLNPCMCILHFMLYVAQELAKQTPNDTSRLIVQAIVSLFIVIALALQLAAVGIVGLAAIILVTAGNGIIEEEKLGKSFQVHQGRQAFLCVSIIIQCSKILDRRYVIPLVFLDCAIYQKTLTASFEPKECSFGMSEPPIFWLRSCFVQSCTRGAPFTLTPLPTQSLYYEEILSDT